MISPKIFFLLNKDFHETKSPLIKPVENEKIMIMLLKQACVCLLTSQQNYSTDTRL